MSCGEILASTVSCRPPARSASRLAGGDHAADVCTAELMDDAVLRRADVDALELVLRGDLALDELADLAVDLAQFLGDLAAQFLIDLNDLEFDLGDLAARLARSRRSD